MLGYIRTHATPRKASRTPSLATSSSATMSSSLNSKLPCSSPPSSWSSVMTLRSLISCTPQIQKLTRRTMSEQCSTTISPQVTGMPGKGTVASLPKANTTSPNEKKGILRSLSFQFTQFQGTRRKNTNAVHTYDTTPEDAKNNNVALGPIQGVQCQGILLKKCRRKSSKWQKRFFVLKECFLLYYASRVQKQYNKTKKIDMHPRGVIPLIGCSIVPGGDVGKGKKFCLLITHPQFNTAIIVAAVDNKAQEVWLKALREATKISFSNTIVGESLIRELENKGMQLNEEKITFEERLQAEVDKVKKEQERYTHLEALKEELEKEYKRLIGLTKKLKDDLNKVKNDLKVANESKLTLEEEKKSLMTKTQHLVSTLEQLNMEKSKIEEQMNTIIRERETFLVENQNLNSTTNQLKNKLMEIESKTTCLTAEKEKVENLLRMNERKSRDLENERRYYSNQTKELLSTLKELTQQKEMTEAELRDEIMARLGAERQLQAAEKALEHLENALRLTGAQMTELQEHILPDVHKLREFFEKCAEEARFEANKVSIMKNAVYARRSFKRNKNRGRSSFRRHTSMKNITTKTFDDNECIEI